jgi:hypothetical protein
MLGQQLPVGVGVTDPLARFVTPSPARNPWLAALGRGELRGADKQRAIRERSHRKKRNQRRARAAGRKYTAGR